MNKEEILGTPPTGETKMGFRLRKLEEIIDSGMGTGLHYMEARNYVRRVESYYDDCIQMKDLIEKDQ